MNNKNFSEKISVIPQWMPTRQQREHIETSAKKLGVSITGYIKQLVNADIKNSGGD